MTPETARNPPNAALGGAEPSGGPAGDSSCVVRGDGDATAKTNGGQSQVTQRRNEMANVSRTCRDITADAGVSGSSKNQPAIIGCHVK